MWCCLTIFLHSNAAQLQSVLYCSWLTAIACFNLLNHFYTYCFVESITFSKTYWGFGRADYRVLLQHLWNFPVPQWDLFYVLWYRDISTQEILQLMPFHYSNRAKLLFYSLHSHISACIFSVVGCLDCQTNNLHLPLILFSDLYFY